MKIDLLPGERLDDLERNGYQLIQNPRRFCYGVDAVLLSWFARAGEGETVLDMGTGNGVIPILMKAKTEAAHLTGLEIQEEMVQMAKRSVAWNHLEESISIVQGDIREASRVFGGASFDVVTCNPPYMENHAGLKNLETAKAIARHEILCTLEDVIREGVRCVRPGGRMYLIHRPHRLTEILIGMKQYRMSPRRVCVVYPKRSREANLVLVEGVRGGNSQLHLDPPVILFEEDGRETSQIRNIHGKDAI